MTATFSPPEAEPSQKATSRRGDRIFAGLARTAGVLILLALAAVFIFLAAEGWNGLNAPEATYRPATDFLGYIGPLVLSTILAASIAVIVAVPFAIGIALFISHYAPRRIAVPMAYVVDLLAAVPSVVFGLWGGRYLAGFLQPAQVWMAEHLSFLPFFQPPPTPNGRSLFTAGIVLAIMILPIVTAISREVFAQTPRLHEEAALALGATRWEVVRGVVFPYARAGIAAALILGLGRAVGEAIAVTQVIGNNVAIHTDLFKPGDTLASRIAGQYQGADTALQVASLVYLAVILLVFSLIANLAAQLIVRRVAGRHQIR